MASNNRTVLPTTTRLSSTPATLWEQSHEAARGLALDWFRVTLRQVALQALQRVMVLRDPRDEEQATLMQQNETDSSQEEETIMSTVLELSASGLEQVQYTCQQVATTWQAHLRAQHHQEASSWLEQVLEQELQHPTLFEDPSERKAEATAPVQPAVATAAAARVEVPLAPPPQLPTTTAATTAAAAAAATALSLKDNDDDELPELVMKRLHKLLQVQSNPNQDFTDLSKEAIEVQMKELLQHFREQAQRGAMANGDNTTPLFYDWPYPRQMEENGGSVLSQAVARLQPRLYPKKYDRHKKERLELPSKQVISKETAALQELLHRKRKSSSGQEIRKKTKPNESDQELRAEATTQAFWRALARTPTDLEGGTWTGSALESSMTETQLAEHLHPDDESHQTTNNNTTDSTDTTTTETSNQACQGLLLGPLTYIGGPHAYNQYQVDMGDATRKSRSDTSLNKRRKSRRKRSYIKERLGGHQVGWECDYGTPRRLRSRSKVQLTMCRQTWQEQEQLLQQHGQPGRSPALDPQHEDEAHWVEADLAGEAVLLEFSQDPQGAGGLPTKTLHAFSSVELMALDVSKDRMTNSNSNNNSNNNNE